eukprot:2588199-Prymnesium_polylepis.1
MGWVDYVLSWEAAITRTDYDARIDQIRNGLANDMVVTDTDCHRRLVAHARLGVREGRHLQARRRSAAHPRGPPVVKVCRRVQREGWQHV